ncbi:hypothetical protein GCM10022235_85510 [Kribbella ginsengisoli]|uniref:Uncharacterized protein n=1 Tax=Kribbella ginsengisoli TaxID=363865 RepID=A0ABP6Z8L7_9ACTN
MQAREPHLSHSAGAAEILSGTLPSLDMRLMVTALSISGTSHLDVLQVCSLRLEYS